MTKQIKHPYDIEFGVKWFKNIDTEKTDRADNYVISIKKRDDLVIKLHRMEKEHKWGIMTKTNFKKNLNKNNGFYEIVSYPHKIYFDVDGKGETPSNYMELVINSIKNIFDVSEMAISGSETTEKKSYHIVLNNYLIHNDEERETLKAINNYLKININGFDGAVYANKQQMKAANQAKPDGRIQKIIFNDDIGKHIITSFFNDDNKTINDIIFNEEIKAHIEQYKYKPVKAIKERKGDITPEQPEPTPAAENNSYIIKLLNILSKTRTDTGESNYKLGVLIKSLNISFNVWFELSKASKYYESGTYEYLLKQWNNIKYAGLRVETLYKWARADNIEQFNKIMIEEKIKPVETERPGIIKINKRYLLNNELKFKDKNNIIVSKTKELFKNKNNVSLNIKSPYDTGKTQYLKEVMKKYDPKRVLWVSYRKTLTYDIAGNFKQFNFETYLDDESCTADRLIVQIESLKKIQNKFDEGDDVASYDLIIIDEIESILNQFSSTTTFKNKERLIYYYFDTVLKNSVLRGGKIITLDGDYSDRAYWFISQYGDSIDIENEVNFNTKKLNIMNDQNAYNNKLFEALGANKKIIMPCMSETQALFYIPQRSKPGYLLT